MNNTNDNAPYGSPVPSPNYGGHQGQYTPPSSNPTPQQQGGQQGQQAPGSTYAPSTQPGQSPHQARPVYSQPSSSQQASGYTASVQSDQQPPLGAHAQHAGSGTHHQQPVYQTPMATASKKSGGGAKTFLLAFLGAALAVVIGLSGFGFYNAMTGDSGGGGSTTVLGSSGSSIDAADTDSSLAEAVAAKALPSVVNIDVFTTQSTTNPFGFGESDGTLTESSLGSGVILSEDGYIITNYHVIEGADALEVTIGDETYQADLIGSDPSSDIAVIKARDASGLTPIEIGTSSDLVIGEWVMTIGSPFGLEQSVATGIVSATSRSQIMESTTGGTATVYTNLIQTDAAINPGNSGGALVDADGKLIGINTLITSSSGSYSGVGFAIPVDFAISLAQQIIDGITPTHAQLGVSLSTVNSVIAQRYGLSVDTGAYVTQVYTGSGAASAGIEVGDIVTSFDGQSIASASDLMLAIRAKNPGDTVSLELNRSGQTMTLDVTLGSDGETTQQQSNRQGSYSNSGALANAA